MFAEAIFAQLVFSKLLLGSVIRSFLLPNSSMSSVGAFREGRHSTAVESGEGVSITVCTGMNISKERVMRATECDLTQIIGVQNSS